MERARARSNMFLFLFLFFIFLIQYSTIQELESTLLLGVDFANVNLGLRNHNSASGEKLEVQLSA